MNNYCTLFIWHYGPNVAPNGRVTGFYSRLSETVYFLQISNGDWTSTQGSGHIGLGSKYEKIIIALGSQKIGGARLLSDDKKTEIESSKFSLFTSAGTLSGNGPSGAVLFRC